jgi:CRP-like cAMP-binding protein
MAFPLPTVNVACAFCVIGSAARVSEGGQCPMVDRHRSAGSSLYMAGTPADTVYYVQHGAVALSRGSSEKHGEDAPYAVRRAGSLIGLEAIIEPTYRDSARAISDVTVCGTSREQMRVWLDGMGTARVVLECVLATSSSDNAGRATTDGNAQQRVARWLLDSSKQKRLPRSILAGLLGMKPETLSRALAAIARTKCIYLTRTRVDVRDAARLEEIANGTSQP